MSLMEEGIVKGSSVLSGDLKLMLALTETEAEHQLLQKMIKRFVLSIFQLFCFQCNYSVTQVC